MRQLSEQSSSESYFWPVVWAVVLHLVIFAMLFVSFQFTPELPPARPIIQTTLYQLKSQSQATTQTPQKIAGEAKKTAAPSNQVEQLETKKVEQQKQAAAAKAAEQKKVAEQKKAQETKKAAETKAAEQKKQAAIAKKKTEEEKKKAAEAAKKKAEAEAAKKKAAAEAAKKKAAQEAARKSAEDKKAQALAELLAENTEYQQTMAESVGSQVAGNLDDLLIKLVSEQWQRPPSARNGMSVEVLIEMLPDGTITNASVTRSSGDRPFDNSAVAAVRNVGRIQEMQQLDRATFDAMYRQRRVIFKPEDLSL